MNIFKALSQGKGSINEENISSFLAYLMEPSESHGLGDTFIKSFLELAGTKNIDGDLRYVVMLEYSEGDKNRRIDILIEVFDDDKRIKTIAIENKVNAGAASRNQFKEEYEMIKGRPESIGMIFLAPAEGKSNNSKISTEYKELPLKEKELNDEKDYKKYVAWEDVVEKLQQILKDEGDIFIEPLQDYLKHTIKAFIYHIREEVIKDDQIRTSNKEYFYLEAQNKAAVYYSDSEKYEILQFKDGTPLIRDCNPTGNSQGWVVKDLLRDIFNQKQSEANSEEEKKKWEFDDKSAITFQLARILFKNIKDQQQEIKISLSGDKRKFSPGTRVAGAKKLIVDIVEN